MRYRNRLFYLLTYLLQNNWAILPYWSTEVRHIHLRHEQLSTHVHLNSVMNITYMQGQLTTMNLLMKDYVTNSQLHQAFSELTRTSLIRKI